MRVFAIVDKESWGKLFNGSHDSYVISSNELSKVYPKADRAFNWVKERMSRGTKSDHADDVMPILCWASEDVCAGEFEPIYVKYNYARNYVADNPDWLSDKFCQLEIDISPAVMSIDAYVFCQYMAKNRIALPKMKLGDYTDAVEEQKKLKKKNPREYEKQMLASWEQYAMVPSEQRVYFIWSINPNDVRSMIEGDIVDFIG